MGLLKLLGIEVQPDAALVEENAKLKTDNVTLMSRVGVLENNLSAANREGNDRGTRIQKLSKELSYATNKVNEYEDQIETLEERVKELESDDNGKKVTYASARKTMSKAKLKNLRAQLEAVPSNAQGFCANVSVYDKKTKRLKVVQLKSKAEALELVGRAEKGNVEIVI